MKRQGLTLAELLISMSLFLLALTLCGRLAVLGMRSRAQGMDRNSEFRRIITLFHQLQQDLQNVRTVYQPDLSDFQPHQPGVDAEALVFSFTGSDGTPQVIGWSLSGAELTRTFYRPDFQPGLPVTQQPLPSTRQLRVPGLDRFVLQQQPPGPNFGAHLLQVDVRCAPPLKHELLTTLSLEND